MRRIPTSAALAWALVLCSAGQARAGALADPGAWSRSAPASWALDPAKLEVFQSQESSSSAGASESTAANAEQSRQYHGPSPLHAGLRSFAVPGWGQLATGHKSTALAFGILELGTWTTFATLTVQGGLRRDSYFDTARLFAGIDLEPKDDALRRLVAQYQSSDVYNQYVVLREATFFYSDPAERADYIARRSIKPEDAWSWDSYEAFLRYRAERRASEKAYQRARYALGFALVNRLASAMVAARQTSRDRKRLEADAVPGRPRGRVAWGLTARDGGLPESRLAWVVTF